MRINNRIAEFFEEFESSVSANVIVQGRRDVLDFRRQLLRGCVQCGERIGEFMLPQDVACALTVGEFHIKSEANQLLKKLWSNSISLGAACRQTDSLVRAAGDTAIVLKNLKRNDPEKFLQVLAILWRYRKEPIRGTNNRV
ncbi:MAG: hypothetical protein JXD19_12045 [Deltaproteobacteria bacterium]|nr:hypothetical protein [Deltaproteobacteria bacterium]